jgi:hypothetical protein
LSVVVKGVKEPVISFQANFGNIVKRFLLNYCELLTEMRCGKASCQLPWEKPMKIDQLPLRVRSFDIKGNPLTESEVLFAEEQIENDY